MKISHILKKLFILPIFIYKYFISPIMPKACRFLPSCSEYAIESIEKFGVIYGIFLICKRLLKCHPFGSQGFDPVPDEKICFRGKKCQN